MSSANLSITSTTELRLSHASCLAATHPDRVVPMFSSFSGVSLHVSRICKRQASHEMRADFGCQLRSVMLLIHMRLHDPKDESEELFHLACRLRRVKVVEIA